MFSSLLLVYDLLDLIHLMSIDSQIKRNCSVLHTLYKKLLGCECLYIVFRRAFNVWIQAFGVMYGVNCIQKLKLSV